MPHAVTVGFTCAIAVTILASQLKDLGGLTLAGAEPGPFFPEARRAVASAADHQPRCLGDRRRLARR